MSGRRSGRMCYKCELFASVSIVTVAHDCPMQALSGSLFAFVAGVLFYLASPRQQLVPAIRLRAVLVVAGGVCCLVGAGLWHGCASWPAAICAMVAALAASLSGMPFIGAMAARRARLAGLAGGKPDVRANHPTRTP